MREKQMAVWRAIGELTFAETLELAETFRDAWESTNDFEASDLADWSFLLNTAREIAEDRDRDAGYAGDGNRLHPEGAAARACGAGIAPQPLDKSESPMTIDKATLAELLPCPFCDSTAIVTGSRDGYHTQARCGFCFAAGPSKITPAEAITAWNTRASVADRNAVIEEAARVAEGFDDTAPDNLASEAARVIAAAIRALSTPSEGHTPEGEQPPTTADEGEG